ncbi:hypothetical protein ACOBR2_16610 [Telmatobacter bradus]|uniref:hypothetical protein n=1 Tax=Telmatobacter bradus TaxID=474953 RepID=UPI003B42A014
MSPDQEKIAQWLSDRSPSLHEAYLIALQFLADPKIPGRAQMICHAGRDLCTGLQDLHSVTKERTNTTPIFKDVDYAWKKERLDAVGIAESTDSAPAPEQMALSEVTIPRYLMALLQRLIEEYRRGAEIQTVQAVQMFRVIDPASAKRPEAVQPLVTEWKSLRSWFNRYTHFGVDQSIPEEQELQQKFTTLENFILGAIRTFYEGMGGLDEILDETNS